MVSNDLDNVSEWIETLNDPEENRIQVVYKGEHFIISRVLALDHGDFETMLFPPDEDGEVTNCGGVYEHRGYESTEDTIRNFLRQSDMG